MLLRVHILWLGLHASISPIHDRVHGSGWAPRRHWELYHGTPDSQTQPSLPVATSIAGARVDPRPAARRAVDPVARLIELIEVHTSRASRTCFEALHFS